MPTLGELNFLDPAPAIEKNKKEKDDDVGVIRSTLSGIASGVFKIPEGAFSLGATLIDLGLDTNTAADVEKFFDKINPFDEAAAATAAGRIAELMVNIGVPGGIAFKAGKNLTKAALAAKQNGNYFTLTGAGLADDVISKGVPKATKWDIAPINKQLQDLALNKKGKFLEYAGGAGLGSIAEGVFVGDVTEAGTLGDLLGGPTELDKETGGTDREIAARELENRLKFGIEGGLFTAGIGLGAVGFNRLRKGPSDTGRAITDPMEKYWNNLFSNFSKRGKTGEVTFQAREALTGAMSADERVAIDAANRIDSELYKLMPKMEKYWSSDDGLKELAKKKEALQKTLVSGLEDPTYFNKQLTKTGRESGFTLDEILDETKELINPVTKKVVSATERSKLIEDGFSVKFSNITDEGFKPFVDQLDNSKSYGQGAPIQEVKDNIRFEMDLVRNKWGDLFSAYGRLLEPKQLEQFKTAFKSKISDFVDSGAKIFNDQTIGKLKIYPASRPVMNEITNEIARATKTLGVNLPETEIDRIINRIYNNATLEKGFNLKQKSGIYFKDLPNLFKDSLAGAIDDVSKLTTYQKDKLTGKRIGGNLSDIKDVILPDGSVFKRKEILEKLIGKSKNGLNTIITGTNRISNLVRRNEINNEIVANSLRQKKLVDEWFKKVNEVGEAAAGPRPAAPTVVNNSYEAEKYFGGIGGKMGVSGEKSTGDWVQMNFDSDIAPIKGFKKIQEEGVKTTTSVSDKITNNLAGKYALTGNADALVRGDITNDPQGMAWMLYKNAILYPKAGAQLAKTVLGPVTHARNFISSMAFAGANGVLLNNDFNALKKAWNSSMGPAFGGKMTPDSQSLYRKLLDLGVVNSNVSQGDLNRLLKDVKFGETFGNLENRTLNNVFNNLSRAKKFAQDAYTAEDDFWKIFTWIGEKTRLEKSLKNMKDGNSLALGDDIVQVLDDGTLRNLGKFNNEWLEKTAANLVKNNVPNYAYVSDFVKGLRQYPVGNFVSFPAEMIRTSTNIVETALNEINFKIQLNKLGANGKPIIVKPFESIGRQRLTGMALTTAIVPTSLALGAEMLYDVSKDEVDALRRYVASWSKNSTLIPIRNEDGSLSYIDFSRMNAYDLLLKPIQSVINEVDSGNTDTKGIMGSFVVGLSNATKDILSPFVESALWTEALQDVLPTVVMGRGGLDRDGRRIWNPEDSNGNILYAQIKHLVEAVAPLNFSQLDRLVRSSLPEGSEIKYDKYGREYQLGKELSGMVGLRAIDVNPAEGIKYKINEFQKNVRNSRALFTGTVLKGGPVSPEEIINAYINANRALFQTNKEMSKDVKAAQILGLGEDQLSNIMEERGASNDYKYLSSEQFKPYEISDSVKKLFQKNAEALGVANPLDSSEDVIDRIIDILKEVPLSGDFPQIENPFKESILQKFVPTTNTNPTGQLPPVVLGADVVSVANSLNQNLVGGVNPQTTQLIQQSNVLDNFIRGR
jgi:hypothetical protein